MSSTWQANNPEKWREYKRAYYAKNKAAIASKKASWAKANRDRINDARREKNAAWYHENKERLAPNELLRAAKRRAKASGIEFSITLDDVVIPAVCPLLGVPLKRGDGRIGPSSPSLDRRDNSKGYVPGNVWVISYRANAAKGDLTADELIQIGQRLKATLAEGASA